MMCIGGRTDNKIRCYTWKYEQPSPGEQNKIVDDIKKGIISPENLKYQPHFDCLDTIDSLYSKERYIIEKLALNRSGIPEHEIMEAVDEIINETVKRDRYANILKKEIENESKKYYNDVEIK